MVYAVQAWLYIDVASEEEAKQYKAKLEALLKNPMVEGMIRGQGIPSRGINVMDPVLVK